MNTVNHIDIDISVELGSKTLPIHQLLRMGRGGVIELDNTENDDLTLLANGNPIAKGQVLLRGDKIMVAITKLLPRPAERRPNDGLLDSFNNSEESQEPDFLDQGDVQGFAQGETASQSVDESELGAPLGTPLDTPMPQIQDTDSVE